MFKILDCVAKNRLRPDMQLKEKIVSHFKQYGYLAGFKLLVASRLRRIISIQTFVFAKLETQSVPQGKFTTSDIHIRVLNSQEVAVSNLLLGRVLTHNETLFVAQNNKEIFGYALTQLGGRYKFGINQSIELPSDVLMLKGLKVYIEHRGKKIGRYLNMARISADHVQNNKIYVTAMIENRAAIKNLNRVGFEPIAEVRSISLFGRPLFRRVISGTKVNSIPDWIKGSVT